MPRSDARHPRQRHIKYNLATKLNLACKSEVIVCALGIGHDERDAFGDGSPDRDGIIIGRQIKEEVDMNVLSQLVETIDGEAFHLENAHFAKAKSKLLMNPERPH